MIFVFENQIITGGGINRMEVPFNVWEVNSEQAPLTAQTTIKDMHFDCNMEPIGKGHYYLVIPENIMSKLKPQVKYQVSFSIRSHGNKEVLESPFSLENPIRKVEKIDIVRQPWDGLCGQACVAMLAGITLEEAGEFMQCREWQASMEKIVDSLDYMGISHTNTVHYINGQECELPKCAVLLEKMGRYSHYLIYFEGKFYDPSVGISDTIDTKKLLGYLEILV